MSRYSSEKYYELPVLERKEALPLENNTIGDRYIFRDEMYIWNGEFWVEAQLLAPPAGLLIQQFVLSGPSTVDEGDEFTVTLTTQNIDNGTEVPFTITGSVLSTDLDNASLTGAFTIQDNIGEVSFTHTADALSDGPKTFLLTLDNNADSLQIDLLDTSQQPVPTYTLTSTASSVNEGSSFSITLTTTAVAEGTEVPYTITGIAASDLVAPGETSLTGNFTIDAVGSDFKSFNLSEDTTTEGTEIFTLSLNGQNNNIQVNIADTSTTPVGPTGGQAYFSAGTYSWTAPTGVNYVSVVCIGGGGGGQISRGTISGGERNTAGGGGGGLVWANDLPVTPGQTYTVTVGAGGEGGTIATQTSGYNSGRAGGGSIFTFDGGTIQANGGRGGSSGGGAGGTYTGTGTWQTVSTSYGGGNGGKGAGNFYDGGGGGGAAGYTGNGGEGGISAGGSGRDGAGGGGGGGGSAEYQNSGGFDRFGGRGGGVGANGEGANGSGASGIPSSLTNQYGSIGGNGSGGSAGYGAGGQMRAYYGGQATANSGGTGNVTIRWGLNKDYP